MSERLTLGEAVDQYLEGVAANGRNARTVEAYRRERSLPSMSRKRSPRGRLEDGKLKVKCKVHIVQRGRRARLVEGTPPPTSARESEPQGRVPRIARLLALAHHIQELIDTGQVQDLAEVARLGHVTRARVTQIMNLLLLAPDIQEEILFVQPVAEGRDTISERSIRQVLPETAFASQRQIWGKLRSDFLNRP